MSRVKKRRCHKCEACLTPNCGECTFCKDKPRFGGKNSKKQCCIKKRCLNPVFASADAPFTPGFVLYSDIRKHIPKAYVLIRNILDKDMLSRFRIQVPIGDKKDVIQETETTQNATDSTTQKLDRPQRKRKVNLNYINPAQYVPTLKAPRKDASVKEDPLKDVALERLVEHLERQNVRDVHSVRTTNQKRQEKETAPQHARPQRARTKKKKLRPYEYLKFLPAKCENLGGDVYPGPPNLSHHDSESTESGDENCSLDAFGPPVLELCKNEKEAVKLSFSGRHCKPNDAYSREFYTDLSKLPNLNNKPRARRTTPKIKIDRDTKLTEEKISPFSVAVKKKPGIVNSAENYGSLSVKKELKVTHAGDSNAFVIASCKNDQKPANKDIESSLNTFMENTEKDKQMNQLKDRIPVCQDKIMKTVKELAKEKKFVKFFQLSVGNKLIFIPTDGSTVIPKAYVMDKVSDTTKTDKPPVTMETPVIKSEPVDDTDSDLLPKITSVFSLSSDPEKDSPQESDSFSNVQETKLLNTAAQGVSEEKRPTLVSTENSCAQKLRSLINPEMFNRHSIDADDKVLQSLLRDTVTKIFSHQQTTATTSCQPGNAKNSPESVSKLQNKKEDDSVNIRVTTLQHAPHSMDTADTKRPAITVIPDLGKLKSIEKMTSKIQPHLAQSRSQTLSQPSPIYITNKVQTSLPQSHTQTLSQPSPIYMGTMSSAPQHKILILPKTSTSSNTNTRVVVSSQSNPKLQSLLPTSKYQFVVNKSQKPTISAALKSTEPGLMYTGIHGDNSGGVSRSPATPLLLFPNISSKTVPVFSNNTTSRIINFNTPIASTAVSAPEITPMTSLHGISSGSSSIQSTSTTKKVIVTSRAPTVVNKTPPSPGRKDKALCAEDKHKQSRDDAESSLPSTGGFGHEWVTVKSEPGDDHEFEASILTTIKKEKTSDSESESEEESHERDRSCTMRGMPQFPAHPVTSVNAGETDTEERIRRLRERMRAQQEECENLKKSLLNESEDAS